jgi:exo-beta-1,3-glucanase (GH17 family)
MSNVHPWFANVSIDQAADWTADFFLENNVDIANTLPNKPQMFIAETGWPSVRPSWQDGNNILSS